MRSMTLRLYWKSVSDSEYVFPSNGGHVFISEDRANDVLKNCWGKAFPDRPDAKIRFHELRSYKISALTNIGANTWAIMKMTGKKVSQDINTYLTGVNLREVFVKGEGALTLTQVNNNSYMAVEDLKKENQALKDRLSLIEEQVKEMAERWEAEATALINKMNNTLQAAGFKVDKSLEK